MPLSFLLSLTSGLNSLVLQILHDAGRAGGPLYEAPLPGAAPADDCRFRGNQCSHDLRLSLPAFLVGGWQRRTLHVVDAAAVGLHLQGSKLCLRLV